MKKHFLDTGIGMVCAAFFANFLWGSAAPCIKIGYRLFQIQADAVMSQILFAGLRFILAGLLAVAMGSLAGKKLLLPRQGSGKRIAALALSQTVIQYILYYVGLSRAAGFKVSVINPSSAFFAVLLSCLLLRQEKLTPRKLLGCLLGFSGVLVINLSHAAGFSGFRWTGEGFVFLSTFTSAVSTVLIKSFSRRDDPVMLSGYQFVLGGAVMMLIGFAGGGRLQVSSRAAWLLLLYLAFISSAAYTLWSLLLQRYPVSRISVYTFINPVFGVLLSALLLGEGAALNLPQCCAALLLVGAGIWVVNAGPKASAGFSAFRRNRKAVRNTQK